MPKGMINAKKIALEGWGPDYDPTTSALLGQAHAALF